MKQKEEQLTKAGMDILSKIAIKLPCSACGTEYEVPLRDVLLSHELLRHGCPVAEETECPPVHQARLFPEESLRAFEQDWSRLEEWAQSDGGTLVIRMRAGL